MRSKIILFILSFSQTVWATPQTLVQSEDVSRTDYEAYLKTEPAYRSAIESIDSNRSAPLARELNSSFEVAERSFLSETVESAHEKYKKVVELALSEDWTDSQRQLIFHSYLRAAQTAVKESQRRQFLDGSIKFDSKLQPDEKLFPPPLVAEWREEKKKSLFTTLQLPAELQQFQAAFINGVKVEFKRYAIRVPQGPFRMTLLSNQYQSVTKVGTVADIREWEPKTIPMSSGTCSEARIHSKVFETPAVLFENGCVSTGQPVPNVAKGTELAPQLFEPTGFSTESKSSNSVFKKPLFWGIVGTVVAVAAYSASRQKSEDAPATHKTGF